ncbi:hypothetical protein PR048_009167 [Dryococelus australis]|uniref:Uncharacterized protein n=1 Tax=Dryococelus australis TaxID=614101 RepID=A0ABQ9HZ56_9NEOP|nr:hypothetical protein PR048_009167 [Dryococelus australis]
MYQTESSPYLVKHSPQKFSKMSHKMILSVLNQVGNNKQITFDQLLAQVVHVRPHDCQKQKAGSGSLVGNLRATLVFPDISQQFIKKWLACGLLMGNSCFPRHQPTVHQEVARLWFTYGHFLVCQTSANSIAMSRAPSSRTECSIQTLPKPDVHGMGLLLDVSLIYLCQTYSHMPKQLLHGNTNFLVLFCMNDLNLHHAYFNHVNTDLNSSSFKSMCSCCNCEPHGLLIIAKNVPPLKDRYRHRFYRFIIAYQLTMCYTVSKIVLVGNGSSIFEMPPMLSFSADFATTGRTADRFYKHRGSSSLTNVQHFSARYLGAEAIQCRRANSQKVTTVLQTLNADVHKLSAIGEKLATVESRLYYTSVLTTKMVMRLVKLIEMVAVITDFASGDALNANKLTPTAVRWMCASRSNFKAGLTCNRTMLLLNLSALSGILTTVEQKVDVLDMSPNLAVLSDKLLTVVPKHDIVGSETVDNKIITTCLRSWTDTLLLLRGVYESLISLNIVADFLAAHVDPLGVRLETMEEAVCHTIMRHLTDMDADDDKWTHCKHIRDTVIQRIGKLEEVLKKLIATYLEGNNATSSANKDEAHTKFVSWLEYFCWDDINELVATINLLIATRQAENTSYTNEVVNLFEELYKAGSIQGFGEHTLCQSVKRVPEVGWGWACWPSCRRARMKRSGRFFSQVSWWRFQEMTPGPPEENLSIGAVHRESKMAGIEVASKSVMLKLSLESNCGWEHPENTPALECQSRMFTSKIATGNFPVFWTKMRNISRVMRANMAAAAPWLLSRMLGGAKQIFGYSYIRTGMAESTGVIDNLVRHLNDRPSQQTQFRACVSQRTKMLRLPDQINACKTESSPLIENILLPPEKGLRHTQSFSDYNNLLIIFCILFPVSFVSFTCFLHRALFIQPLHLLAFSRELLLLGDAEDAEVTNPGLRQEYLLLAVIRPAFAAVSEKLSRGELLLQSRDDTTPGYCATRPAQRAAGTCRRHEPSRADPTRPDLAKEKVGGHKRSICPPCHLAKATTYAAAVWYFRFPFLFFDDFPVLVFVAYFASNFLLARDLTCYCANCAAATCIFITAALHCTTITGCTSGPTKVPLPGDKQGDKQLPQVQYTIATMFEGGPGLRPGLSYFDFPWFPEITSGECRDNSLLKAIHHKARTFEVNIEKVTAPERIYFNGRTEEHASSEVSNDVWKLVPHLKPTASRTDDPRREGKRAVDDVSRFRHFPTLGYVTLTTLHIPCDCSNQLRLKQLYSLYARLQKRNNPVCMEIRVVRVYVAREPLPNQSKNAVDGRRYRSANSGLQKQTAIMEPETKTTIKNLKEDAWGEIGSAMCRPIEECRNKIVCLLSSYRREKSKESKTKGTGKEIASRMCRCLQQNVLPVEGANTVRHIPVNFKCLGYILPSKGSWEAEKCTMLHKINRHFINTRQLLKVSMKTEKSYRIQCNPKPSPFPSKQSAEGEKNLIKNDKVTSFFTVVTAKVKGYSPDTRKVVEHAVFDILMKADTGYYERRAVDLVKPRRALQLYNLKTRWLQDPYNLHHNIRRIQPQYILEICRRHSREIFVLLTNGLRSHVELQFRASEFFSAPPTYVFRSKVRILFIGTYSVHSSAGMHYLPLDAPSSGIIHHDSYMQKSGSDSAGNRAQFSQVGDVSQQHCMKRRILKLDVGLESIRALVCDAAIEATVLASRIPGTRWLFTHVHTTVYTLGTMMAAFHSTVHLPPLFANPPGLQQLL